MKRKVHTILLLLLVAMNVMAQNYMNGQVVVSNLSITRSEGTLFVSMDMDLSGLEVKSDQEVQLTPVLRGAEEEMTLPGLLIAGRNRYYVRLRNAAEMPANTTLYRASRTKEIHYEYSTPYLPWMQLGTLMLDEDQCGCRCEVLASNDELLASLNFVPKQFRAYYLYQPPKAEEVKVREVRGQAYIDFPVNRTEIHEEYRRNPEELQKIRSTIEVVKNDPDVRITSIGIKGYASPEGSYSNNTRLAEGRTETLKNYVQRLYNFDAALFHTDFEPEDWDGLRRYVDGSSLEHKAGILDIIDGDMQPDSKDRTLRSRYPQEYAHLLKECYPALRHSDYVVEYVVRAYTDVEEAKRVLRTAPGNLSLQEFYMVANSYEPGSDAYNEVFDIMVRLYPNDEVANLNAANVAMSKKDYAAAHKYLTRAGNSPLVTYASGVLAAQEDRLADAKHLFQQAAALGVVQADEALQQVEEMIKERN